MCLTMLHRVPSWQRQDAVLAEIYRLLRLGGVLAGQGSLGSPDMRSLHRDDVYVPVDPPGLQVREAAAGIHGTFARSRNRPTNRARNPVDLAISLKRLAPLGRWQGRGRLGDERPFRRSVSAREQSRRRWPASGQRRNPRSDGICCPVVLPGEGRWSRFGPPPPDALERVPDARQDGARRLLPGEVELHADRVVAPSPGLTVTGVELRLVEVRPVQVCARRYSRCDRPQCPEYPSTRVPHSPGRRWRRRGGRAR